MSIEETQLEVEQLIQRFVAARSRVSQTQRNDHDKRLRKLEAELSRLQNYDPDIDLETPEEMAAAVLGVARRLEVYLPEEQTTESLAFILPAFYDAKATMQAQWDGKRWTLTPQRLAVYEAQALADHLDAQVCQTNDLDLWRASLLPAALRPPGWSFLKDGVLLSGGEG